MLKGSGNIAVRRTNRYSLITIVNWEEYQWKDEKCASDGTGKRAGKEQSESSQKAVREQQVKNIKNNKNINNTYACAKRNKFNDFEQKPIDYEAIRKKNLERLLKG